MAARRRRRSTPPPKTTVITLDITDLSRGGAGVGRDDDGRAVFVPLTLPGDVVRVSLCKTKRRFAEAVLLEIITPSPLRVTPRCAVYTQCGGCQWQHIPYELQWRTKEGGVRESLRLAKVELPKSWDGYPAQQEWAYRNRVQLRGEGSIIGFYARQSNTLVPIQRCEIVPSAINEVLPEVRDEGSRLGSPYKVELNLTADGSVTRTWNSLHSASGFRQVNDQQNNVLQHWIKNLIESDVGILDLYGGSGNLSLPLQELASEIHCVDVHIPQLKTLPVPEFFHFHQTPVLPWLAARAATHKQDPAYVDSRWVALIDPPRDGLGDDCAAIAQALENLHVTTVILVGCKTDPWARDLALFIGRGWRMEKVAVFDFFPQTYHVESVAMLVYSKPRHKGKSYNFNHEKLSRI